MPKRSKEDFLTKQEVLDRGWTEALIHTFLGEPDLTQKSRFSRRYHLYATIRVTDAEAEPDFRSALADVERRRGASARGYEGARDRTLAEVDSRFSALPPSPPVLSPKELLRAAICSYNSLQRGENVASVRSDQAFLERIQVNFLRHERTAYEALLAVQHGKLGAPEARSRVRARILDQIARDYPQFEKECYWQKVRRELK